MSSQRRITIKHVAQQAGVSTQTVSRVLNERPDVSPKTRRRVQQIIEHLGYQPSALARSLIQQRSRTLGVVTAGLKYIGPSRTLNGIARQVEALGYTLLLKELPDFEANDILPLLQSLLARQVDGILWAVPEIGENRGWLRWRLPNLPTPILFLTMHAQPGLSIVSIDNCLGARFAVQHLIAQGYQRIGHISGPLDWWEARQRKSGWEQALQEADIPPQPHTEGNWSSASGERAFLLLIEQYPEIDAVFVANDQMALGAMLAAWRLGKRIPHDLGVAGFDNLVESAYFIPPLTTIQHDQYELGCQAASVLVERIEAVQLGEMSPPPQQILLQPQLVVRESSTRI